MKIPTPSPIPLVKKGGLGTVGGGITVLVLLIGLGFSAGGSPSVHSQGAELNWEDVPSMAALRHQGEWLGALDVSLLPPPSPSITQPHQVGDEVAFHPPIYTDRPATPYILRYRGERAYYWFPPDVQVDTDQLAAVANRLENRHLPRLYTLFGEPSAIEDIDSDPRLHIAHVPYIGFGAVGVFDPIDQCPPTLCERSQGRDLIYYSLHWAEVGSERYFSTLTHEYQHLLRYHLDGNETRWLNEGFSQLGQFLNGFALADSVGDNLNYFLANPDHQLGAWAVANENPSAYYGSSFLFLVYLYEQFGLSFIQELSAHPYDGLAAIHRVLATHDTSLDAVFTAWLIANWRSDYAALDLPTPIQATPVLLNVEGYARFRPSIQQYGAHYLQLAGGTYDLSFQGASHTPLIADMTTDERNNVWWSVPQARSLATLTRRVDLRDLSTATLTFALWYDVEPDYDWGALVISTDGGQTWQPLTSQQMRPPSDAVSLPHYGGQMRHWRRDTVDLSPYVGEIVQLRFLYATDDTITESGLLLDDLRIPELGWRDDAEHFDSGWEASGFIRTNNQAPQNWAFIYLPADDPAAPAVFLPTNGEPTQLRVPSSGGVLIIGAMAPLTSVETSYTLDIQRR